MRRLFLIILLLVSTSYYSGCSMLSFQDKIKKEKEALVKKEQDYQTLKSDLSSGLIKLGTTKDEIKEKYTMPEPEEVFVSGSSMSQMEVWSYDGSGTHNPLKLYFENQKLISWSL